MYDEYEKSTSNSDGNQQYSNQENSRPENTPSPNFVMRDPEPSGSESRRQDTYNQTPPNGYQTYRQDNQYYGQVGGQPQSQNMRGAEGSQYQPQNGPYIPNEKNKKPKKKHVMATRIAGITAAALLFGTVAGGTMVGVNMAADFLRGESYPGVSRTEAEEKTMAVIEESQEDTTEAPQTVAAAAPAISMDVSAIVEKAMPSVVAINNTMLYQSESWFGPSQTYEVPSSGSGIIVGQNDTELLVVTNNHVVQDSKELQVVFIDDTSVKAAIKGTDAETDLAVVAVSLSDISSETLDKITVASLGDSDSLKVGQGVIAIGNALGYGQSVTVGYVSALDREVQTDEQTTRDLLQTDAAINPGNSGGALLNMLGEVIGINAAKYSSTDVEGMGYAIPISKVQDIIDDLMSKKTRVRIEETKQGYLGIQGQNVEANNAYGMPQGVYVYKIVEGGAAAGTELREKDIITKFDGQSIRTMADLKDMLTYYEGGTTVTLTVQSLENGQYVERSVDITLGFKSSGETN